MPSSNTRFLRLALRDLSGSAIRLFMSATTEMTAAAVTVIKQKSHHILVVDRSGSMWGTMDQLKTDLVKLLTLSEFEDANMVISLISYSGQGDVTTHFSRVPVDQIMAPNAPFQASILKLRPTGLTCISQALKEAEKIAVMRPGESCCITLHTDGQANDPSPASEKKELLAAAERLSKIDGVWASCIAHSSMADFGLLSQIAGLLGGTCIMASSFRQIWDALKTTQTSLAGNVAPALVLKGDKSAFISAIFVGGKVMSAMDGKDVVAKGTAQGAIAQSIRFQEITEAAWMTLNYPIAEAGSIEGLVLARALIANGRWTQAKQALVDCRLPDVLALHALALTPAEVGALAADLDGLLAGGTATPSLAYGVPGADNVPVTTLLDALVGSDVEIDVHALRLVKGEKRGMAKMAGSRQADGTIEVPWLEEKDRVPNQQWQRLGSVDANDSTANVNILLVRPIKLVETATGVEVTKVAGKSLDKLSGFANHTVIGDGQLVIPAIKIRTSHRRLASTIAKLAKLPDIGSDAQAPFELNLDLKGRPLTPPLEMAALDGAFDQMVMLKTASSILEAMLKGKSDDVSEADLEALKKHYLSPAMYVSIPSTTRHPDLAAAIASGHVDSRVIRKVMVGNGDILSLAKLHSANKLLDRLFTISVGGSAIEKPTMLDWWTKGATFARKVLGTKLKVTAVDKEQGAVMDEILGLGLPSPKSVFNTLLLSLGHSKALEFTQALDLTSTLTVVQRTEILTDALKAIDKEKEAIMEACVRPLVMQIGASGMLPDELADLPALNSEELAKKFPTIAGLGKPEADGTFYLTDGGTVISIFVEEQKFTTQLGLAATASVPKAANTSAAVAPTATVVP